jgi:hypothetical protein
MDDDTIDYARAASTSCKMLTKLTAGPLRQVCLRPPRLQPPQPPERFRPHPPLGAVPPGPSH